MDSIEYGKTVSQYEIKLKFLKPENFGKVTWVSYESVEYRWVIPELDKDKTN